MVNEKMEVIPESEKTTSTNAAFVHVSMKRAEFSSSKHISPSGQTSTHSASKNTTLSAVAEYSEWTTPSGETSSHFSCSSQSATMSTGSYSSTMRRYSRSSLTDHFDLDDHEAIPAIPRGGARVKVHYAGACYTEMELKASARRASIIPGMKDTSLFAGYEISGVVDELSPRLSVDDVGIQHGDRVIVHMDKPEQVRTGFTEYVVVDDIRQLVKLPDNLSLEVAALLPSGALTAYSAVMKAKPFVDERLANTTGPVNFLVVGGGGLGLWTVCMAKRFIAEDCNRVRITVADPCTNKLQVAREHGCFNVVHWHEAIYEQQIVERTKNVCPEGVDIIVDFVSSQRTTDRASHILKEGGVLLVGGSTLQKPKIDLDVLARKEQSVVTVKHGSRTQLENLVHEMASGRLKAPIFSVFPLEEADEVYNKLNKSQLEGRAVLRMPSVTEETYAEVFGS